jgi:hypothetical protein
MVYESALVGFESVDEVEAHLERRLVAMVPVNLDVGGSGVRLTDHDVTSCTRLTGYAQEAKLRNVTTQDGSISYRKGVTKVADILFAVALLVTVVIAAVQFGADSRDGYGDDHQRVAPEG